MQIDRHRPILDANFFTNANAHHHDLLPNLHFSQNGGGFCHYVLLVSSNSDALGAFTISHPAISQNHQLFWKLYVVEKREIWQIMFCYAYYYFHMYFRKLHHCSEGFTTPIMFYGRDDNTFPVTGPKLRSIIMKWRCKGFGIICISSGRRLPINYRRELDTKGAILFAKNWLKSSPPNRGV